MSLAHHGTKVAQPSLRNSLPSSWRPPAAMPAATTLSAAALDLCWKERALRMRERLSSAAAQIKERLPLTSMAGSPKVASLTLPLLGMMLKAAMAFPELSNAILGAQGFCSRTLTFFECIARPQTVHRIRIPEASTRRGIGL